MFSSEGFHTFEIKRHTTQETADSILQHLKNYRDKTGELYVKGPQKYEVDPKGRHCFAHYTNQRKGIVWKIRFSNNGFWENEEYLTCSIKAIINPKIMVGEKSYIKAANVSYLEDIENTFNEEVKRISPLLGRFEQYSLSRIDYCINFDLSEVIIEGFSDARENFHKYMMQLISYGDIPKYFKREYINENQFYLRCNSVVINCYWKHADLLMNFKECEDLEKSKDIIRFEVQFKYPKVYSKSKKYKEEKVGKGNAIKARIDTLSENVFLENESERNADVECQRREYFELLNAYYVTDKKIMKYMLSDEKCSDVINEYFEKIIGMGHYYTYRTAEKIIERDVSSWEKIVRLKRTLLFIGSCKGIKRAKDSLSKSELTEFRRSLRELNKLGINPVTIPEEWGVKEIPNLLANYYKMRQNERLKKQQEEFENQVLTECMKANKSRTVKT